MPKAVIAPPATRPAILDMPGLAAVLACLPRARLVGGCVRDTLAGCPVADVDLATPDPPNDILAALSQAGLKAIPTGLAHGTITAISAGQAFEITTLRRDEETDGRHARVAWTDDFAVDAARRDFTINAMSMDRTGAVFDFHGGQADLAAGRVRFVGAAAARIAEDHLRILRFFRFYARYAAVPPDGATAMALSAGTALLAQLSAERVWGELRRILAAPDPGATLALMDRLGVLAAILPEAADLATLARMVDAGVPADPVLRLSGLLTGSAETVAARLRMSTAEARQLTLLLSPDVPALDANDATLRRLLADTESQILIGRLWRAQPGAAALRARLAGMMRPVFPLQGRDALAAGLPPGPGVGAALAEIRVWWRQGGCVATKQACEHRLRDILFQG